MPAPLIEQKVFKDKRDFVFFVGHDVGPTTLVKRGGTSHLTVLYIAETRVIQLESPL